VQRPEDIERLLAEIKRLNASRLGLVLKIETQAAFNRLPTLLLTSMRHPPVAVMVARGDLGVEVGFERLSEVQEEILWLCEAAHVPVIWATQVLESLAKGGMPSRAEVTDAAMGSRAECVMLNKGPYIRETLRFLIDVLGRMEAHQYKKSSRLRKLRVSDASTSRTRPNVKAGRASG
jgi:pyruvate kinase